MRGTTQAHLITADDGVAYVLKLQENPFGPRTLINELMGSALLQQLGLPCPTPALVRITPEFIRDNPTIGISAGGALIRPGAGLHYGSRYPGDPERTVVYDFIPDSLLDRVDNLNDFVGMLLIDILVATKQSRQCIFVRHPKLEPASRNFAAMMIDHDGMFGGNCWELCSPAGAGHYVRPSVYHRMRDWRDCEPWLSRIASLQQTALSSLAEHVPGEWFRGENPQFYDLLSSVLKRREELISLVEKEIRCAPGAFRNWNATFECSPVLGSAASDPGFAPRFPSLESQTAVS